MDNPCRSCHLVRFPADGRWFCLAIQRTTVHMLGHTCLELPPPPVCLSARPVSVSSCAPFAVPALLALPCSLCLCCACPARSALLLLCLCCACPARSALLLLCLPPACLAAACCPCPVNTHPCRAGRSSCPSARPCARPRGSVRGSRPAAGSCGRQLVQRALKNGGLESLRRQWTTRQWRQAQVVSPEHMREKGEGPGDQPLLLGLLGTTRPGPFAPLLPAVQLGLPVVQRLLQCPDLLEEAGGLSTAVGGASTRAIHSDDARNGRENTWKGSGSTRNGSERQWKGSEDTRKGSGSTRKGSGKAVKTQGKAVEAQGNGSERQWRHTEMAVKTADLRLQQPVVLASLLPRCPASPDERELSPRCGWNGCGGSCATETRSKNRPPAARGVATRTGASHARPPSPA